MSKKEAYKKKQESIALGSDLNILVRRIKRRDVDAMKIVYNQYVNAMITVSQRITGNLQDAEEIVQSSFLNSFEKIDKLKDPEKFGAWLKRSVVNRSVTHVRKRKMSIVSEEKLADVPEPEDDHWFSNISIEKIRHAIMQLPEGCRRILTLYLFEEYKHKEIAVMLDVSVSTSKSQYQYALKLLRKNLQDFRI